MIRKSARRVGEELKLIAVLFLHLEAMIPALATRQIDTDIERLHRLDRGPYRRGLEATRDRNSLIGRNRGECSLRLFFGARQTNDCCTSRGQSTRGLARGLDNPGNQRPYRKRDALKHIICGRKMSVWALAFE